jgi:hypothetical protein
MLNSKTRTLAHVLLGVVVVLWGAQAFASEPVSPESAPSRSPRTSEFRPRSGDSPVVSAAHPMLPVLQAVEKELTHLRRTVHDFRCRVVKRERVNGILQDYSFIDMWVREETRVNGRIASPLSVYMVFRGPSSVVGRRLLFVEGRNEGKILARKGGQRFEYVVTKIDPHGESAKRESLLPITQSGFAPLLDAIIAVLERHAATDPAGENTEVQRIDGAKVDGRPCYVLRITHPKKQAGLEFHTASIFIDNELRVPVRIEKHDWPTPSDRTAPLISEYNYTKVKLNLGLSDEWFDPTLLTTKR